VLSSKCSRKIKFTVHIRRREKEGEGKKEGEHWM
jgi:hypothetical protein